ncbi:CDP-diacylglycerol--serine O-phosphatidyltransferase [Alicyclobacillus acidiphilus]|uniref:CDP-diacylglycerol--serine O-phosphatidyltransferase n=1 Tax=Alicyclobacillus acidiphilus TaxID=182455 RepID=UPI00082E5314|nr:CDP-diacylglycerol--serine O-phosphatidyltransferase [Alicyclobacillus acidiphilus]
MLIRSIPSALTLLNLGLGLIASLLTLHGRVSEAALFVVVGMVLDGLDGRIARLLHAESEFGKQLDSLADIVTFGAAPALIVYQMELKQLGVIGDLLTLWFPMCGAIRLARFHMQTKSTHFFVGLPITAAGGVLATLTLMKPVLHPASLILSAAAFVLSMLMISRVRYPNFKRVAFPRALLVLVPMSIGLVFVLIHYVLIRPDWLIFGILGLYACYGLIRSIRYRVIKFRRGRAVSSEILRRSED